MTTYAFSILRSTAGSFQSMFTDIEGIVGKNDIGLWGRFMGLFGLASNELILVTYGAVTDIDQTLKTRGSIDDVSTLLLEPTVRPTENRMREKEGLYVFRTFSVNHKDVEEIAALSKEAWTTFETAEAYNAIPQALFCQKDRSANQGTMLLVTWYDGLNSWQTSRQPPDPAGKNFRRRSQLTLSTKATATRLVV